MLLSEGWNVGSSVREAAQGFQFFYSILLDCFIIFISFCVYWVSALSLVFQLCDQQ